MVTGPMAAAPAAVIDALNGLLEAELSSMFRSIDEQSPYVGRASAELRHQLQQMSLASDRHAAELSALIEQLGGYPVPRRAVRGDEQYLAYLSLKFLVPKLADEKQLIVQCYENALAAMDDAPDGVTAVLNRQLAEHRAHLQTLRDASTNGHPQS